jgi:hypothetical protein
MKIHLKDFRIPERATVRLGMRPTEFDPGCKSGKHNKERLEGHVAQLSELQSIRDELTT